MAEVPHPIDHIPLEILQEIFISCTCTDQNDEGYNVPDVKRAPLVLSYVSSSWRQLALHTPELWCCLHLDWTLNKRWSPSLLGKLWLSRCDPMLIHLSIHEHQDGYLGCLNTGTHFAFGYAARLFSLSLMHKTYFDIEGAPIPIQDMRFPLLWRLELRGWIFLDFANHVDAVRCPQLCRYKLDLVPFKVDQFFKGTKQNSLTHLDIHKACVKEDELDLISDMFPLISTLYITVELVSTAPEFDDEPEPSRPKPPRRSFVELSRLRRTKLTLTHREHYWDRVGDLVTPMFIFNRLITPNLITFETNYDGIPIARDNYYIAFAIYDFVQRSQCSLEELSIHGWERDESLNGARVLELASSMPTLRKLAYGGVLGSYGFCSQTLSVHQLHEPTGIHPLIRTKDNQWEFLPLLEELHCHIDTEGSILDEDGDEVRTILEYIGVISQRMKSSTNRLKRCRATVVIRRPSGVSRMVLDALLSLTKLGLTHVIKDLTLPEEEGIAPGLKLPQRLRPLPMNLEEWTAYPRSNTSKR